MVGFTEGYALSIPCPPTTLGYIPRPERMLLVGNLRRRSWVKEKYSYTVMHQLIKDRYPCSEPTVLRRVDLAAEIHLNGTNTLLSVKGLFSPQQEPMSVELTNAPLPTDSLVVFGVRPCDARSLTWLQEVFEGGGQEDPYFCERRKTAPVISVTCEIPARSCFCASVGGSPYGSEGADILASAAGKEGSLLFEAITDKCRDLLQA